VSFEQTVADLKDPDSSVRLNAVRLLKEAAYPEGAVPIASVVVDAEDAIQAEAIAAELNIFLADHARSARRAALVVERRGRVVAESVFTAGPLALSGATVPAEVLIALRTAAHDETPQIAVDALYAFGALGGEVHGNARKALLRVSGGDLAPLVGSSDRRLRLAAARVVGRLFAPRPLDDPIDPAVGDALITAMNDRDTDVRRAAMHALGVMRYARAVQALTELFQFYTRGDDAEASFEALADIAHGSSVPLFVSQLTSKSVALKVAAIEGLSRVGDRARIGDIQTALLGERNDPVLLAARFSAVLLSGGSLDPIVEDLVRERHRDQAFGYLVELARGRARLFARAAQDPDTRMRADVADALGLSGDPEAIAFVEPMKRDQDPRVVQAAERAALRLRAASPVSN
jgi:HEAT repeat protein